MAADAVVGTIVGDVVGSVHESRRHKVADRHFPLLTEQSRFTDDSVLTIAVADAVRLGVDVATPLRTWSLAYPHAGYGRMFVDWMTADDPRPYGSYGNGSAMRVSPVAYAVDDLDEVLDLAAVSADVTHDHREGIRGAQAVAGAILVARLGGSAGDVRDLVAGRFGYDLDVTVEHWRATTTFDVTCQGTVPAAVRCFLESTDLESAVRNAVYVGGDADTLAAIAGGLAAAAYGVPAGLRAAALARLDDRLTQALAEFEVWAAGR